jgi:hypothetical protein
MDEKDDGYFHFDKNHPPMYIAEDEKADNEFIQDSIKQYLRSSYQNGIKHPNAILDSGLTAGEAAMIWLRNFKDKQQETTSLPLMESLSLIIKNRMGFDPNEYQEAFNKHLQISYPFDRNIDAKLSYGLKAFLKEINKKPKGYTYLVKNIILDIKHTKDKNRSF